ncbi:MAG: winged helix-turn-helix domain-containing protein [Selenomonadaceae bacterium]|nr:winged helix-turn-helix domain-containing protein [Selenomonadaceae bacterium]
MKFSSEKKKDLLFKIAKKIKYNPDIPIAQISKDLNISRTTTYNYIKELENEQIVYTDLKESSN